MDRCRGPDRLRRPRDRAEQYGSHRLPLSARDPRESPSTVNLDVEVRFVAVAGKIDQAAGIGAVRLQDADNYYLARANLRLRITFDSIARCMAGANSWMGSI